MSNHFSAANLRFPGNDRRLDLTDVFAFASLQDPDNTVLIIDSNPTSAPPPIEAQARCTSPTGLSGVPPPGPAIPVTETAISARAFLSAPSAMARAQASLTAPCVAMT